METCYKEIIQAIGEDPDREGLKDTPKRAANALKFLTKGYQESLEDILNDAVFSSDNDSMVIVKDIEFYSLCEHHILPFIGKCHIGYIPSKKVIGLSKIPRLVDTLSRRLQIQESLTKQIADTLHDLIQPQGVGVIMEAQHLCMTMRGVQKQHAYMKTSAMLGLFRDRERTRNEFLQLIYH